MADLFTPLRLGSLELSNRIWMAPLTRCRAEEGHVPGPLMAEYYGQRAGAGLIITEATMVMAGLSCFGHEPGLYNQAQVDGWRLVTDAVHRAGGHIVVQLWHGGRACHPLLNGGVQPVGPSPIAITSEEAHTPEGKRPHVVPRELRDEELPVVVEAFRQAARAAMAAGFDGVEIHGANGYLLDAFLRDGSNQRTGPYGGSIENRARLLLEVLEAVAPETPLMGLRLSPLNGYQSMVDRDPIGLISWLAQRLNDAPLGYLHLLRGDALGQQQGDVLTPARQHFRGPLVANMAYTAPEANAAIGAGSVDAVAFGRAALANPDLPERFRRGAPLNEADPTSFYSSGPAGYTDYPALDPPAWLRRPAAERFHSQLDWLDSWHTFSFSSHYDPAWMGFGPLRVINDDTIAAGQGFGMHPHRDMEIITVMVEGELHHRDSMGHAEVLRAGEVQRMSAGTGVVHSEINGGEQPCRLLQIWIEPSASGLTPAYEQKPFPLQIGWTPLLDPQRRDGALAIHRPVQLWRGRLEPGMALELPPLSGAIWIQLIDGGVASPWSLQRGDGLGWRCNPGASAPALVAGSAGADLLLFQLN